MGTVTLKRFNGIEKFRLAESRAYVTRKLDDPGTIIMWFEAETEEPIETVPDTDLVIEGEFVLEDYEEWCG
ncbi:hypothetical protein [Paenibacillus sp. J2TS4]|uniref:hypothetical protein n=1 Tax=Paenibacillus sp. J2TS4 TaxID=2807194 RepID=UPI001B122BCE|nr:hypothetical protein [Paenibacillus sp. J2TS4]GIP32796.1 hypothetical protein J2TS4_20060 [Paenibacillus sp. J2TS4]